MNNAIMDYEQVEEKLVRIVENGIIKKEEDLGNTSYGLPIHHYTVGNGEKEIVVTGATHGCEIISTDFVINLMEKISNGNYVEGIDLNKYKIHFIPMLNPEGYLISTSAIRKIIPRDMSPEEAEKVCKDYYLRYRKDDAEAIARNKKIAEIKKRYEEARISGNEEQFSVQLNEEIEEIEESVKSEELIKRLERALEVSKLRRDELEDGTDDKENKHITEEDLENIETIVDFSGLKRRLEDAKELDSEGKMRVLEESIDIIQLLQRLENSVETDNLEEFRMIAEVISESQKVPIFRNPNLIKHFQWMFRNVDYTCIPEKYSQIRKRVKEISEKYTDIPKGTLQIWSANANGIDPQANCEFNDVIARIFNGDLDANGEVYKNNLRYSNINSIHPGPINCGYDPDKGFSLEPEIQAVSTLLQNLSKKGTLHSYFNYHGTGGVLYQRPLDAPEGIKVGQQTMWTRLLENYAFSKFYARKTYKDVKNQATSRYRILTGKGKATSSNDIFRIKYPRDILVELSGMGGNPIGPYGDLKGNYQNLMKSNLEAFKFTVEYADISEKISNASLNLLQDRIKNGVPENIAEQMYRIIGTASNMMMSWIEKFGRKKRKEVLSGWSSRFHDVNDGER